MADKYFIGRLDRYNGVTIDSNEESCKANEFKQRLSDSLTEWRKLERRTIWFCVHLSHTLWIPILIEYGFKFHHAKETHVMLYLWLDDAQECHVPSYAHTNVGVGAFVLNEKTNEILVVKEQHSLIKNFWKLPGGHVEPGQNLQTAIEREVSEETGIKADFKSVVTFRHGHNYAFNCSDIYMVAFLIPHTFDIKKCNREISECMWMKLDEYAQHPEVHNNNKTFAKHMQDFLKHKMGITVEYGIHPITKKPICVYSINHVKI
ncbi:uncharacterized protein [Prorops nasuta]